MKRSGIQSVLVVGMAVFFILWLTTGEHTWQAVIALVFAAALSFSLLIE